MAAFGYREVIVLYVLVFGVLGWELGVESAVVSVSDGDFLFV